MKSSSFQIILLVVFGALALAGVLVFAFAVGGKGGSTAVGKVVIWGTLDKNAFTAMLDQASQQNQDLQGVSYVQKDPDTYEQDISDALAQQSGPDIFVLSSDYAYKNAAKVQPITPDQFSATDFQNVFADAANTFYTPDGMEAVPFAIDPLVLYWNRDILATNGYAQPPTDWGQVEELAAAVTTRDDSGEVTRAGIALGTYQNIENAKPDLALILLQKGVPITTRSGNGILSPALTQNTTGGAQPGTDALTFFTSFSDPSQSQYSWNDSLQSARSSFAAGDAALYIGYASEAQLIQQMNPNLNFAIAPVPQLPGTTNSIDSGRVYAFAVPRVAANQRGALLASQLLDSATTTIYLTKLLGIAPARRDALSVPAQGYPELFNKMAIQSRGWIDPDPVQTNALFRAMIENSVSGAVPVAQALQQGGQQLAQILQTR